VKLTRDFQPNADHGYNLADGTVVQSAKFGSTQVDVWQDAEPGAIWRGSPKVEVGRWPVRMWRYAVHGEMSGCTLSEAVAKSEGEFRAWDSSANRRNEPHYRHQVSRDVKEREAEEFKALIAQIDRDFPADMEVSAPNGDEATAFRP